MASSPSSTCGLCAGSKAVSGAGCVPVALGLGRRASPGVRGGRWPQPHKEAEFSCKLFIFRRFYF